VIFIVVRFKVADKYRDSFLEIVRPFTESTLAEPGNLWFEWARTVADPNEFVLMEAFRDAEAGAAHVQSQHFQDGLDAIRPTLTETPRIVNTEIAGAAEWSRMGELEID
jgi:quinol monooxygenase YgiN